MTNIPLPRTRRSLTPGLFDYRPPGNLLREPKSPLPAVDALHVKSGTATSVPSPVAAVTGADLVAAKAAAALEAAAAATATSPAERRRSVRRASNFPAWLSDQSGGRRPQQQRVTVTDMSMHGVGFVGPERVEVGATHWIVVAADQLHLSTRLRVVSVRQRPDGAFDVGAEFF